MLGLLFIQNGQPVNVLTGRTTAVRLRARTVPPSLVNLSTVAAQWSSTPLHRNLNQNSFRVSDRAGQCLP